MEALFFLAHRARTHKNKCAATAVQNTRDTLRQIEHNMNC